MYKSVRNIEISLYGLERQLGDMEKLNIKIDWIY